MREHKQSPDSGSELRSRLYEAYASTHSGVANRRASRALFTADILPHLPVDRAAVVVDVGCGQGVIVECLARHGYKASFGVDISAEQVALAHAAGVSSVVEGDYRTILQSSSVDVIVATDFLEHLDKAEVLEALDGFVDALRPGGRLILRVPNAVSPFGGNYRYGDFTHETSFTSTSVRQLARAVGLEVVKIVPCLPAVHGFKSALRHLVVRMMTFVMKLMLVAETGLPRGHVATQNLLAVLQKADAE